MDFKFKNCWEVKRCHKETKCPAALEKRTNGINGGINGGRACWAITGTECGNKTQGSFFQKMLNCKECDFYKLVRVEQGNKYISSKTILDKLK